MATASVGTKVRGGFVWLTISQILGKGLSFLAGIALARLLFPEDYGLNAMAVTVSNLVSLLGTMGVGQMLIQQHERFDDYANAGLRLNILIGICLFFIQIIVSPFAGQFYNNPIVTKIMIVSAIGYLIWPLGSVPSTILTKTMQFKKRATVGIVFTLLSSSLSVLFALSGFGVWSFVIPRLLVAPVEVGIYWYLVPWRPSRGLRLECWAPIFRYGRNILAVNILGYVQNNTDYLLIGKILGSTALGIYTFGFEASVGLLRQFLIVCGPVLFSAFSTLKKDPLVLKDTFFKYASLLSLIIFPGILLLGGTGPEFITGIYGEKWNGAVVPFILLAISSLFRPIGSMCYHLANAVGRPDLNMKWNLCTIFPHIVILIIGIRYGIIGVAAAMSIGQIIFVPLWIWLCLRMLKWNYGTLIKTIAPAFVSGIIMLLCIILVRGSILSALPLPKVIKLLFLGITGIAIYLVTLGLLFKSEFHKLFVQIQIFIPQPIKSLYSRKTRIAL
jgi:O-antigen/teichoic acid export membrane protein